MAIVRVYNPPPQKWPADCSARKTKFNQACGATYWVTDSVEFPKDAFFAMSVGGLAG
jgi:hypothetical protein